MYGSSRFLKSGAALLALVITLLGLWTVLPSADGSAQARQSCDWTIGPGDVSGLIAAIEAANASTYVPSPTPTAIPRVYTICLANGDYLINNPYQGTSSGLPSIDASITIWGDGARLLRTAGDPVRFFVVNDSLTLEDIQLQAGSADFGGAIYNSGQLTVRGSLLAYNTASNQGGAIYNLGGSVTLDQAELIYNDAGESGGGIANAAGSVTITGSTIRDNESGLYGAGVYNALAGTLTVNYSVFHGNAFDWSVPLSFAGGSIYNQSGGGLVTVHNSCLVLNEYGMANHDSAPPMDATDNWWGAADGPSGFGPGTGPSDPVSENIAYVPFLTEASGPCGDLLLSVTPPILTLPLPTASMSLTPGPSISATITDTPSSTAPATPAPDCDLVRLTAAAMDAFGPKLQVSNFNSAAPVFITRAEIQWLPPESTSAHLSGLYIVGRSILWTGIKPNPPAVLDTTETLWEDDASARQFSPQTITTLDVRITVESGFPKNYMTINDFVGTRLYFSTTWGAETFDPAHDCMVEVMAQPVVTPSPRGPTTVPECQDYIFDRVQFDPDGVVRFIAVNNSPNPVQITGFRSDWNSYSRSRPMVNLDFVSVGGTSAFDPDSVVIWDGDGPSPPTTGTSGDASWLVNAEIPGSSWRYVHFDFDGTVGPLYDLGYVMSDLEKSTLTFGGTCVISGQILNPTPTPTNTLTPSKTPLPTSSPEPSSTPSRTATPGPSFTPGPSTTWTPSLTPVPSNTATATPHPACDLVRLETARLVDQYLEIRVNNLNSYGPVFITRAEIQWHKHPLYPAMYLKNLHIPGRTRFWLGMELEPPSTLDTDDPGWLDDEFLRRFEAASVTPLRVQFANGPAVLGTYLSVSEFSGTRLYFSTLWAGSTFDPFNDCMIEITETPVDTATPVAPTPVPVCGDYTFDFVGFETSGVVRYIVVNHNPNPIHITGFRINWDTYNRFPDLVNIDFVSVGGTSAFDPETVVVWDGNVLSPPATGTSGVDPWLVDALIPGGGFRWVFLDFDGTAGPLSGLGYQVSDFDDSSLTFGGSCVVAGGTTPRPTYTPMPSFTPSKTPMPSDTPLPSNTPTPWPTSTPSPSFPPVPPATLLPGQQGACLPMPGQPGVIICAAE